MDVTSIPPTALPVTDPRATTPLKSSAQPSDKEKAAVRKVAREFESMFVSMMLKSMRSTVGQDKLTGGGHGEETYRSLLDEKYAEEATKSGTIGLAATLEKQLLSGGVAAARSKERADR